MYLLIISQYYYSRHSFIVALDENKVELQVKCKALIEELETYKRNRKDRPFYYGDISDKYFNDLKYQRNVNDEGDIYFIPRASIASAVYELKKYWQDSRIESTGYQKKAVLQAIYDHHQFGVVESIVKKYFEIL